MNTLPMRFRRLGEDQLLFAHEAGGHFLAGDAFLGRLATGALLPEDAEFLRARGFLLEPDGLAETAFLHKLAARLAPPSKLNYVLLVPTLRCDLSCSYCQVSRAAETARGFDWTDETLAQTLGFLDREGGDTIQVEFQGGEPTLRLDLVKAVTDFCRKRFRQARFVLCTNLSRLDAPLRELISASDVFVSTSLDGPERLHQSQRTGTEVRTDRFLTNLRDAAEIAPGRVAALPTLDPACLPSPAELLDSFDRFGMRSIYLRQVVFQGFARKRHPQSRRQGSDWSLFYEAVVGEMIRRNSAGAQPAYDEYYLVLAMKRLLRAGRDTHIDLRSPNWLGHDHLVIDYDGTLYPTDEARMMARTGQIDLSLGTVGAGIDEDRRREMQGRAFNALDPWCSQCVYQTACGSDPVDDIARAGRADLPKPETAFCQRHLQVFDLAAELLASADPAIQTSIAHWLGLPGRVKLIDAHDCA